MMGSGDEAAAIALLKRAVELDSSNRLTEAVVCYKEGIQLFLEVVQQIQDKNKKVKYREKASEYLQRCEVLDAKIKKDKQAGKFHEHLKIQAGSIGHGYETLFGRFLSDDVKKIEVEDPYIRTHHQIVNFLRCCELFIKKCSRLQDIRLTTSEDVHKSEQENKFTELRNSLKKKNVQLTVEYSPTLHDREIKLDTGWIIKIGRGLDIFRAPDGKIVLGYFDLDLRPCLETTVDIFFKNDR